MRIGKILDRLLTGAMVFCAVLVAAMALRAQFATRLGASEPGRTVLTEATVRRLASAGNVIGAPTAPVKIIEFSDFQCPYCARVRDHLDQIRHDSDGRVAVVYRHFPLDFHKFAFDAAVASHCAGEQGRFEPMHDALFAGQDSIGKRPWLAYAQAAGVPDSSAFNTCMSGPSARSRVRADRDEANRLKLQGTPALIVGRTVITGEPAAGALEDLVRAEMARRVSRK